MVTFFGITPMDRSPSHMGGSFLRVPFSLVEWETTRTNMGWSPLVTPKIPKEKTHYVSEPVLERLNVWAEATSQLGAAGTQTKATRKVSRTSESPKR